MFANENMKFANENMKVANQNMTFVIFTYLVSDLNRCICRPNSIKCENWRKIIFSLADYMKAKIHLKYLINNI